jgi:hypothetical protein
MDELDNVGDISTTESLQRMGLYLGGISWKMVQALEIGARQPGIESAVRIQDRSASFAKKNRSAVRAAGLRLPIRGQDWRCEKWK